MRKICLLAPMCLILLNARLSAQKVNTDSLKLVSQISKDQLKLGELQNSVSEKTKDKQDAAEKAQASADDNRKAANSLSSDPQDKKLARQADRKASAARNDAKKARIAASRLDDLNKDIADQQEKIAKAQAKLNQYTQTVAPPATPAPAADSVPQQH